MRQLYNEDFINMTSKSSSATLKPTETTKSQPDETCTKNEINSACEKLVDVHGTQVENKKHPECLSQQGDLTQSFSTYSGIVSPMTTRFVRCLFKSCFMYLQTFP